MNDEGGKRRVVDGLVKAGLLHGDVADVELESTLRALEVAKGESVVARALAGLCPVPPVILESSTLDPGAASVVPRIVCEREGFVPVALTDDALILATWNPSERPIFDQLRFVTGRSLVVYFALPNAVKVATTIVYDGYAKKLAVVAGKLSTSKSVWLDVVHEVVVDDLPPDEPSFAGMPPTVIDEDIDDDAAEGFEEMALTVPYDDTPKPPMALVVEDDEGIRGLLVRMLRADGFVVEEAASGAHAISMLRTLRPNVAILDAMLPEVHGFEICRALKSSPLFAGTPVVMISAVYRGLESAWEIEEVVGADAFIEKPFDIHFVRKLIANLTGKPVHRQGVPLDRATDLVVARAAAENAYRDNDADAAITAAKAWIALDPFDPTPYIVVGNVCHRVGNREGALRAYERAATFGPDVYAAWKNLGIVSNELGFTQKAERALGRAASLAPDDDTKSALLRRVPSAA